MKITLINPNMNTPYPQPPLGLLSLAAVCLEAGHEVQIVDVNALRIPVDKVVGLTGDSRAIGITAMTPAIEEAKRIAGYIRHQYPNKLIMIGGVHATIFPEQLLATGLFDVVVPGEGEQTILRILTECVYGNYPQWVACAKGNVELDSLPLLPYGLLHLSHYKPHPPHGRHIPWLPVITSRGCPYGCAFCSKAVFGHRYRDMSPAAVVHMMQDMQLSYGVKEVSFYDDIFTLDRKRTMEICELILSKGIKMVWSCETRVNLVDPELLVILKRAGCHCIAYGIESGDQGILDSLNKGIKVERVEAAVRWTREANIDTIGYFMLGAPGETMKTMRKTREFAVKLGLDYAQFGIACPLPGSQLYDTYLAEGNSPPDWPNFQYVGGTNRPMFTGNGLNRLDIESAVSQANRRFYLRPGYVARRLSRALMSWDEAKLLVRGAIMYLRAV